MGEGVVFAPLKNKQNGDRKRFYLFIVDENKLVVNKREQQLLLLKPDFVANGQFRHCSKENVLFLLKSGKFELWNLPASYFFGNPKNFEQANNSFTRNFFGQIKAAKSP